jgi:hypothetical protein
MNVSFAVNRLQANAAAIEHLVGAVDDDQAHWQPSPADWSIVEVINHLADEERLDFRLRLDYALHRPAEPVPPIDPVGWVTQRAYNARSLDASLADFLAERRASVAWLAGLADPAWDNALHFAWGTLHAGDVLAAWLAHDSLHIRQLAELHRAYVAAIAAPYRVHYAGDW